MKNLLIVLIAAAVLFLPSCSPNEREVFNPSSELDQAAEQLMKSLEWLGDTLIYPRNLEEGSVSLVPSSDWTSGFFPGMLWMSFEHTGDQSLREAAHQFTMNLEQEKFNDGTHDLGFMLYCSFGNGLRLTGNSEYRDILIQGAETLITRFNPMIGAIKSWKTKPGVWQYPVIIDNMMNLELLFWASKETGDPKFYDIAVTHAETTIKSHFRPDNSSYHVISFDTITGEIEKKNTHQGYDHESAWSRGQAWGLYGFTMMYRETGDEKFLDQATLIAEFILGHPNLPGDKVPYWDYDAPGQPDIPRDASAAAITSSALYELSGYCEDGSEKQTYLSAADHILASLASGYKLSGDHEFPFLLDHSTGIKPENKEVDIPIIYADYYFLEALSRKKKLLQQ